MANARVVSQSPVSLLNSEPPESRSMFNSATIQCWDPNRFLMVARIQEAFNNKGQVYHMLDTLNGRRSVAVKQVPNEWICLGPEDFEQKHNDSTEHPWSDISFTSLLDSVAYPYACPLVGVYRGERFTYIVAELASGGDLFSWCGESSNAPAGPAREALVLPLAKQILDSLRQLHDLSIVHRDLSLENLLLTRAEKGLLQIRLIDFGKASRSRYQHTAVNWKPSYQAPEVHSGESYDGFLSDTFAVGVTLYSMLLNEYPWLSTRPGACVSFEYFSQHGFHALMEKRKLRGQGVAVQSMSEPLVQLLAGLLAINPADRLVLGEAAWTQMGDERKSVWQEPWLSTDGVV